MTKRCLICEKEIVIDDIAVHDATVWTSPGNYGSSVYDPVVEGRHLEAYVCDACLKQKKGLLEEVKVRTICEEFERRPPDF